VTATTGSVSIKDVAQHAGVSVGTVSNVLNQPDRVAPATRSQVLTSIRELGYIRNEAARHLRAGRGRTIGLVVLDVANQFFTDVARGVERLAAEHATMTVLCNSAEDPARERQHVDQLSEQRVLGVLITPIDGTTQLRRLTTRGIPYVLVDRASDRRHCSVAVDDRLGGRLVGAHLAELGHRRIAFVGGPSRLRQVSDRHRGLLDAVAERCDRVSEVSVLAAAALTVNEGRRAAEHLRAISAATRPTAAFCANDLLALGLLQQLTKHGIRVPDDIAIVGYDDIEFAVAAAVPLSSVRQPRESLGRMAMELLLDEIHHENTHTHRQVVFQPELVVRESSTPQEFGG
jgi:LacI family transcriptional regulator